MGIVSRRTRLQERGGLKYFSKLARLSKIKGTKTTAEAWISFCEIKGAPMNKPDPFVVEAFCDEKGKGGPTAPKHTFEVLRWREINIGPPAYTDGARVRRAVDPPHSHVAHREEPWEPAICHLAEQGMGNSNDFVTRPCLFCSCRFSSAFRPCPIQRVITRLRNLLLN